MIELLSNMTFMVIIIIAVIFIGLIAMLSKWYHKASQGTAMVRTGVGGTMVSFSGMIVVPVLHRLEIMDISVKNVLISRIAKDGLLCKDNLRADIKVAFFVRVNKTKEDVVQVAQSLGCARASDQEALVQLFDSKFSEALKTVGKHFDFVELYNSREKFKQEILQIIGTDLNGYILDDAAIDYLEQTPLEILNELNILDSEGIRKIIDLTSKQRIHANLIKRETEKTITQQDVEAREAVLELERQLAETEEKQKREVATMKSRQEAETYKIQQEERQKYMRAKIAADEDIEVAQENKQRQVIIAQRNKERTDAIEQERIERDRALEQNERERVVTLAEIEKEKAIEEEKKNIQVVIRERVAIEKTVVEEQERIADTRAFAEAGRSKKVAITKAEQEAEEVLVKEIKAAEASKQAAEFEAKQRIIEAEAEQAASIQKAEAIKVMAQAEAAREAAVGMAEAQVMEAKASAREKEGDAEAHVIEITGQAQSEADKKVGYAAALVEKEKGIAQADVIQAKAEAEKHRGLAEAEVLLEKLSSEAKGIAGKAEAMKKLDGAGKEHEEFKLQIEKKKAVQLAAIAIKKDIAEAQASVLGEALKSAKIDIVGGENVFFDKIVNSITVGKSVDRFIQNSDVLTNVKTQLLESPGGIPLKESIMKLIKDNKITSDDVKNITISALLMKLMKNPATKDKGFLEQLLSTAEKTGFSQHTVESLGLTGNHPARYEEQ